MKILVNSIICGVFAGAVFYGLSWYNQPIITTAQCPALFTQAKEYVVIEGMDCVERKSAYWDLLQPSGVWGFHQFECSQLEQPINEYCLENPDHCADRKL